MRHFCRRAMVPVLALFALSCASSSELARRSETALRSHDYDRAYREAKASLEKDSANGRARMALSAAATHLIERDEQRIVNLATLDTLEAAEACLDLEGLRAEAVRFGATLPVHAEFASRALRIRTDAAGKLYRSALVNTKQARPKQAYRELVGVRRYVAGEESNVTAYQAQRGIPAKLVRAIVVGPIARLELLPMDASAAGSGDIIEAQIGAQQFREQAYQEGEILVLTPRKARVFVA